jgi:ankyrin repeat protein
VAAAARGDLEAVRALIEAGVDVNAKEPMMGLTALEAAKVGGHKDIVELLRKAGAEEKKPS